MDPSRAGRYDGLAELDFRGLYAFSSASTIAPALAIARRCSEAHRVLRRLFGRPLFPELLVLGRADWPGRAALPTYGVTHYDRTMRAIVAPGEPVDFLTPAIELVRRAAPEQLPRLHAVYGGTEARPDLTAHVDTWVAHDLGHGFHLDHGAWLPRRWLMELFADLCAYTALAAAEPAALPALMALPRALNAVPPSAVPLSSLADFERHYGGEALDVATYLWYHGRLLALVERLHAMMGEGALRRLWELLVLPRLDEVDEAGLAPLLAAVSPLLASAVAAWPGLPEEGADAIT